LGKFLTKLATNIVGRSKKTAPKDIFNRLRPNMVNLCHFTLLRASQSLYGENLRLLWPKGLGSHKVGPSLWHKNARLSPWAVRRS